MSDFTWDLCPRCGATGTIEERIIHRSGVHTGPVLIRRGCGACDGRGRVKVPVGYRLEPVQVARTITLATANRPVRENKTMGTW